MNSVVNKLSLLVFLLVVACTKDDASLEEQFFYLRNDDADMPVWVEGNLASNQFMVIVHGGPGGNAQIYNDAVPDFSDKMEEDYAVVYWDQRGSGTSKGNYDSKDLNVNQFVDDLDALVDVLKFRFGSDIELFLLGHSWGGTLTAAYLLNTERQAKISAWIEVDGAHNFQMGPEIIDLFLETGQDQISKGNSVDEWQEIITFCEGLDRNNISLNDYTTLNGYGHSVEEYLQEIDSISSFSAGSFGSIFRYNFFSSFDPLTASISGAVTGLTMIEEIRDLNYTPQLDRIAIPCLFLWGKWDHVVPLETGIQAFNAVNTSQKSLIVFPKSGHSPMISQPTAFHRELKNFIDDL